MHKAYDKSAPTSHNHPRTSTRTASRRRIHNGIARFWFPFTRGGKRQTRKMSNTQNFKVKNK